MINMGPFISCFSFLGSCINNFHDCKLVNILHCCWLIDANKLYLLYSTLNYKIATLGQLVNYNAVAGLITAIKLGPSNRYIEQQAYCYKETNANAPDIMKYILNVADDRSEMIRSEWNNPYLTTYRREYKPKLNVTRSTRSVVSRHRKV